MNERPPLSLSKQADLIDGLADRCAMMNGEIAAETYLLLERSEVEDLRALAVRLRRMGPYESVIRDMVMGKRK